MVKRILRIILILMFLVTVTADGLLFFVKEAERAKRIEIEEKLWNEKVLKKRSEKRFAKLSEEHNVFVKKKESLDKEVTALELEVSKIKSEVGNLKKKLSNITKQISSNEEEIAAAEKSIASSKRKTAAVIEEIWNMKKNITELEKQREDLLKELSTYSKPLVDIKEDETELSKEEIPSIEKSKEPLLKGEILTINREFNFVVINLGKADGIDEEMVLEVRRDKDVLGQIQVETVKDHISAAAIIAGGNISKMRGGDLVLLF